MSSVAYGVEYDGVVNTMQSYIEGCKQPGSFRFSIARGLAKFSPSFLMPDLQHRAARVRELLVLAVATAPDRGRRNAGSAETTKH
jgi:hypothetical protein